ncbi:MAG: glycosyltransferase family 4 protein [Chitinophagales bacterium]|nr:glycosyltransferase family 4 protein [Chitinophagales bacterium]
MPTQIIFLNTHPIQYFAPLYKKVTSEIKDKNVKVWYCSKHGLEGEIDKQFGVSVKWDLPILEGYQYKFLKNSSWKPSIYNGFWGLFNWEILKLLRKEPKSLIIIHGWNFASSLLSIIGGKLLGHKIAIRGEAPITLERLRSKKSRILKGAFLRFLSIFVDHFFYIGQNNYEYYISYGISKKKLIFTPYAVDNERFQKEYQKLNLEKMQLRQELKLDPEVIYTLYSGKYIEKKHPMDLLLAITLLQEQGIRIGAVLMGEGALRPQLEAYIREKNLSNIHLTGFINQNHISKYYTASDLFVMCSDEGETWGLSTNEAMNFALPIILYNAVGCCPNLVNDNINGFSVDKHDITQLANAIKQICINHDLRQAQGKNSLKTINNYSYNQIIDGILLAINGK